MMLAQTNRRAATELGPFGTGRADDAKSGSRLALARDPGTLSATAPLKDLPPRPVAPPAHQDALFERLIQLKVSTSELAMHLEGLWRAGLFKQLDGLLDPEDWDASDDLPTVDSFKTFLRMIIYLNRVRRPGLAASSDGHVVATWTVGSDRLTIECLPQDSVRWLLTKAIDGERVRTAGVCPTTFLPLALAPYSPQSWFDVDAAPSR